MPVSSGIAGHGFAAKLPATPVPGAASIRGAIYVPAEAYNAPQLWKNFSLAETRRDFKYAKEIHLNALRLWASYEYWRMEPEHFHEALEQMLAAAHDSGLRLLISLLEKKTLPAGFLDYLSGAK